jgi:molecular chaperone GrpE
MENTSDNEKEVKDEMVPENISDTTAEANAAEKPEEDARESEIAKLKGEVGEAKDKYIRLYSEFDNFRKRTAKEKLDMIQLANEQLIKSLLPVIDDFERAEKSFKEKNDKDLEGFFLIHNKFKRLLDQSGVKVMELPVGADFDTDLHEAITQIPAPSEKLKGKIVDVVEKGYLLNDKVIRFAKVVIGG